MIIFKLPDLGEGLPNADITQWHIKVGDKVNVDQPIVSMETAKAVVDIPAPHEGVIAKLFGEEGDTINTGEPLVAFENNDAKTAPKQTEKEDAIKEYTNKKDTGTVVGNIQSTNHVIDETAALTSNNNTKVKVTPAVRALAKKAKVDLATIIPSRADGVITRADIENATNNKTTLKDLKPLKGTKRFMAEAMSKSHQEVVAVTLNDIAILPDNFNKKETTTRLIKALITACSNEPALNARFHTQAFAIEPSKSVDIGLAIDTPEGLFVPVIKEAESLSDADIQSQITTFKEQALNRTLTPTSMQGATITLSNFGSIAGRFGNPIIVPPQVAILGVGRIYDDVIPLDNKPVIKACLPLSLSFDHRAVTGGEGARFLKAVIESLQSE